jgi:MoxR-like ATPase
LSDSEIEFLAPRQDLAMLEEQVVRPLRIDPNELSSYVERERGLRLRPAVYAQVAAALDTGKHVLLLGEPGTGKTELAHALAEFAGEKRFATGDTRATATADWTTFDTIGGYVPTRRQGLQFRAGLFLRAVCLGHWLVIDEINRAEIDKALGELFTVLSGQRVDLPYTVGEAPLCVLPPAKPGAPGWVPAGARGGYEYVVHPSWRVIATMNAYDRSYLFSLSFALTRRFAFVTVGLPPEEVYRELLDRWLAESGLAPGTPPGPQAEPVGALREQLRRLLGFETPLMRRRPLGPAIARDMIRHVGDRHVAGAGNPIELLGEAFLLHAVHQLDGLDRASIEAIVHQLDGLFRGTEVRAEIRYRIHHLYPFLSDEPGAGGANEGGAP